MKPSSAVLVGCALSLAACQERDGPCPEILDVTPAEADRAAVVEVTGRDFALGHADLFDDDDGAAVPPTARLVVSPELLEMFAPEMEGQEVELTVESVAFVSDGELAITMPDMDWDDLASGLEMAGVDATPPPLPVLPIPTILYVQNPAGCEVEWDGTLTFNLEVPQEEGGE